MSESKYQAGFGVIISGKNPLIPIYSTTVLYDTTTLYDIDLFSAVFPEEYVDLILFVEVSPSLQCKIGQGTALRQLFSKFSLIFPGVCSLL